ncbi:hypothetical protein FGG08_000686 [Glutinoglossum americanum]|uniref:lactoylglutathione lyase n=1 Tax=Glutinoglossum americanum TaxID=1670608 RepID=A0A9P8L6Q4_9PEZI|nr:hypothetical protein FGG08_000686 [Glutinoglossum americanum]
MATTDITKYKFVSTALRVKDPEVSIKFYNHLGLSLIKKVDFAEGNFTLYFLAYDSPTALFQGKHLTDREGVVELIHNHGTENDPDYRPPNGNAEPYKGFGHICVSVDNIQAACKKVGEAGYGFQKRLEDGRMKFLAFALDPDGYWVEIVCQKNWESTAGIETTDLGTYRMNHSMIRVKDIEKSLSFYKDVMGMTLLHTHKVPEAKFDLYFLGYPYNKIVPESNPDGVPPVAAFEGLLELTYNYGTEADPSFSYHDGNTGPQGFGGIVFSVDDLDAACARYEELKVRWKKRLGEFPDIALIFDPDGYTVEIVQNESIKKRTGW